VFPHDCGDLNDLTNINIAVASNPNVYPVPGNRTPFVPFNSAFQPYPPHYGARRSRHALSVGPGGMGYAGTIGDPYYGHSGRHPSGHTAIKFRLKGSTHSGITVKEALDRVRLSQANAYLMHDVSVDMSNNISLKIRVRFISSPSPVDPFD
jgi:hypothetical protein